MAARLDPTNMTKTSDSETITMKRSQLKSPSHSGQGSAQKNQHRIKKKNQNKKNRRQKNSLDATTDNSPSTKAARLSTTATVRTDPDALGPAVLLLALIFVQLSVLVLGIWLLVRLGAFIELGALMIAFIAEHRLEEHAKKAPSSKTMTMVLLGLSLCPAAIVAAAFFIRGRATVGFIVLAVVPLLQGFRGFVRWRVKRSTTAEASQAEKSDSPR